MTANKLCEFVPAGMISRPRYDNRGRLRFEAKPAWTWINPATGRLTFPPMTRREAQEFAKNQGQKAVFRKDLS